MKNTNIQWTDHTWNIAVGCRKVDGDCKNCYMYRDSLQGTRYNPREIRKTKTVFNLPLKLKEPSRIFTSSLTDFFLPELDQYRQEAWDIIKKCPQHTFQILTKRPERIWDCLPEDWGGGYPNVWLGTSVGSPEGMHRLPALLNNNAVCFFVSLEPLWGGVDITPYLKGNWAANPADNDLDWIIVGGESGNDNGQYKYRPCEAQWIERIVRDCKEANTPVFVKQMGTHLAKEMRMRDRHGGDISEFPPSLQIREFPQINLKTTI